MPRKNRLPSVVLVSGLLLAAVASPATLEQQRVAFREAYPAAERGDWAPVTEREDTLRDYVLWPDLRAAWLRAQLKADASDAIYAAVEVFLEAHPALKTARELRYRLALALARDERSEDYLALYESHYRTLGVATLDCLAVHAGILAGNGPVLEDRAVALWLVGRSQVDECDPVFEWLRGAGILVEDLYRQRYDLAISAREFSLARYLARSLDEDLLEQANRWIAARDRPEDFLQSPPPAGSATGRQQLVYALERVTYHDAGVAADYWRDLRPSYSFSPDDVSHVTRHIALWAARQRHPDAFALLRDLPPDARDVEVRRWLVRTALARRDWEEVIAAIDAMPANERQAEEWRYWLGIARSETGKEDAAAAALGEIAAHRSYYGFLAADELDRPYAWSHAAIAPDEETLSVLAGTAALIRARELFHVGQESRGRSEWNAAVAKLDAAETAQAAILAHRWSWHSQAIATAASLGLYDDLEIRYPFAFRDLLAGHAAGAGIPESWAYGIARSESLFMADVRSGAGAIGVMQLMPETGRRTASALEHPYAGLDTLTDPDSNILLGTHYLGEMLARFGDNRAVATAAYNAGPHRVEEWLPLDGRLDARIWIENIPYNETRKFVRRVLVSDAIFHWRLTGRLQRLSAALGAVDAAAQPQQVAGTDSPASTDCAAGEGCGERAN
jgi:soluble lytic murein transglycosylase